MVAKTELFLMPYKEFRKLGDIVLRHHEGRTFAILVDHNLIAEGEDEADALSQLSAERQRFFSAHATAGTEALLGRRRHRIGNWMLASACTAFVLVAVVLAFALVFEHTLSRAPEVAAREMIRSMDKAAYVAEQISPERQRELAAGPIRLIAAVRPFVVEIVGALKLTPSACDNGGTRRSQLQ